VRLPAASRTSHPARQRPAPPGRRGSRRPIAGRASHGAGFWLIAAAFTVAMAFSTIPAPLYPLYQKRDHFSSFTVTVVFAAYAVGVAASLLLAGHVSDWLGRRRVLIPALALEGLSALLFLTWPALPGLITARVVNGLAIGMITATATAHLHELHSASRPGAGPGRFEVVSTAANIGGLGAGTLIAGFLAQFVPAPLQTPYLVFLGLILASVVAVGLAPETVDKPAERPRYRPQRISAAGTDRTSYLVAAACAFAAFAIFGLFTSLAPGFVAGTLHHPSRLLAGAIVFVVFGAAALAQTTTGRMSLGQRIALGLSAEAAGMIVLAAGLREASLAAFLIGGALSGAAAGVLFKSAIGTVAAVAAAEARGEALAGLFLIAYVGIIVPTVGLGVATLYIGATTAVLWFTGLLLVMLAATAALAWTARRNLSA
jgi:MFS family permease